MAFILNNISFKNFRNHEDYSLLFDRKITILLGANAVGKTNIIEGIQLITTGESFKKPSWQEVISFNKEKALISAVFKEDKKETTIQVYFLNGKREYSRNNNKKRIQEIQGEFPAIIFTPDDLKLVKESAEKRRNEIDLIGTQLSQNYRLLKNDYEKALHQRNLLLKDDYVPSVILESWTESIVSLGILFLLARVKLFNRIKKHFLAIYNDMFPNEEIKVTYIPSWEKNQTQESQQVDLLSFSKDELSNFFNQALALTKEEENARHITVIGPHKDDIAFIIKGNDARKYGSQGQQRTVALLWKLAEVQVFKEITGTMPLLLLDDVMSELDSARRNILMEFIKEQTIQTIITTTNIDYFSKDIINIAGIIKLS